MIDGYGVRPLFELQPDYSVRSSAPAAEQWGIQGLLTVRRAAGKPYVATAISKLSRAASFVPGRNSATPANGQFRCEPLPNSI